ncbi:class I glutamine amidotransferase-like protein [Mycena albidolilacea]|uniref:D-lactate dehydratase n=1 Tax=Mycena albidolilacea TaxID=1033008 RepID=A0AAD7A512_9AGAR|nr:class I glutamine amidotransferase-like protein [Mycena albidolilacea]
MLSAVILLADGTEEMEFTITYDTLVRAGVACCSAFVPAANASVERPYATGSRGIRIMYDAVFGDSKQFLPSSYDALVIPGGAKGAETMSTNLTVQNLVRDFLAQDKIVGMICAGGQAALTTKLPRQPLTSHPSVKAQLENDFEYSEEPVVVSNKLVTSRGPGTAFPFALTLVELLCGADKRAEVRAPMVFPPNTPF